MPGYLHFLRCVGKAAVRHGGRALLGLVPLGEQVYDIACDALADYRRDNDEAEFRREVAALALAGAAEARHTAEQVVREVAADQPAELKVALISYLSQVPAAVRQSLRRPEDPTGTTLPAVLSLKRPEDVVRLLPSRLPRFKPGDRPIAGVSWELVELLGVGGFGEVWKARHLKLTSKAPVALKFCLDAQAAKVLVNEMEVVDLVMAQGPQPGIVPLLDAYLEADPPCLAYQLIEGGDLGGYIQKLSARGGLSPELATQILLRLARTMAFAHGLRPKPIVHRDLKPANILVQRQGDGKVTLWIADFGIGGAASAYTLRQEASRRTSHQQSLPSAVRGAYTPLYASPQQRRGDKPDPRDDIHALGVIWHQLLVGDLTAERPGGRGWRKKLDGRLASGLIDLLDSCIDDDADERPAHAGDLAEKIERLLTPAPKKSETSKEVVNSLGMTFAWIGPGTFVMGSPKSEAGREPYQGADETQHPVTLTKGFYCGVHQVTRGQFARFVQATGYKTEAETSGGAYFWTGKEVQLDPKKNWRTPGFEQTDEHPVVCVSWNDAVALCAWLTHQDGQGRRYRLPSEAEWEYACRAGTTTAYPWGDRIEDGKGWCNIADLTAKKMFPAWTVAPWEDGYVYTSPVGVFRPNAWGLYDVIGNVWEWCEDWFGPYPKGDIKDYKGPEKGESRVFRGGSWSYVLGDCRAACRHGIAPSRRYNSLGCRVVFCLD